MERREWNAFVVAHGPTSGSFLQSVGWAAFQTKAGKHVKQLELDNGSITSVQEQSLGFGLHYVYIARGPIGELNFNALKKAAGYATFIRLDLPVENYPITQLSNYQPAPHNVQPPTTIILDLTQGEETLLAQMHEKTRYNIRVAERHGIEVGKGSVDEFLSLLRETSARDKFRAHPDAYYRAMLADHGDPDLKIFLAVARHEGKAVAAAIFCDFGKTRTYLHGASSYEHRNLMAPYALQWHMIKAAKAAGLTHYDFWGIANSDDPAEPLAGVTRFKKGWGGEIIRYAPTMDLILKPWRYRLYRLLKKFR